MKVHVAPTTSGEIVELSELKRIQVIDLVPDAIHRPLWRSDRAATLDAASLLGLPGPGYRSPMGFWLTSSETLADSSRTITFAARGEESSPPPASLRLSPEGTQSRPIQAVRIKAINASDGDVLLTIGPGGARIVATPAAWKTMAEPILLAACQYWRFSAIDAELDRLTEQAKGNLGHATMPGIASLMASRHLARSAEAVRVLLLDIPHFEGPLTDPYHYCSTERSAQTFESLAEKLHLEEWCELIDEHCEAVEDTYEAVTEKLFEYKNFAWEAVLETSIIIILLGELALMIWENFGP